MASVLWLTDTSRYIDGLERCPRLRFLRNHWGPYGYGMRKKAQSIPLSTGRSYHQALATILEHVKATDQLPPDALVREAAAAAVRDYQALVSKRGLQNLAEGERLDDIIAEQSMLIEGLVWAFALTTLPWLHEHSRILEVEREEILILGCTCGLGPAGELADHETRDCEGVGWQSRPDVITEYRARPGVYAYWEFKGGAYPGRPADWETKIQFAAGALGAQARLEIPIAEAWVIELLKGRREGSEWDPETRSKSGPLMQNSTLCYWYRQPANPPLTEADWREQYEWFGEDGKNHKLGKSYQKTGLWRITEDLPELTASGIRVAEAAAKFIPRERLGRHVNIIGPLIINATLTSELTEELLAEETKWKAIVWELYDILEHEAGGDWTAPAYQAALRRLVPRSWSCRRYGERHGCEMIPICFSHEGWRDPLGSGVYLPRRPHHQAELEQLAARGLEPEDGWEDEEETDG